VRFLGYDPQSTDDTLASRLRAVRRRLGPTQEQLAARARLDEGSVCRWESGSQHPCRWMAARVDTIVEHLEHEAGESTGIGASHDGRPDLGHDLSFFDLTRWCRKLPPGLLAEKLETLGDRIRSRRLELGLSQEALGTRFGVGRVTV
jgi:transcriptional regulator with XRE-family HTH domain